MGCCGGFIGQVFNPVVETVVNPIVEPVIEQVVQPVVKAVEQTVQAALDNPLQTAAIATAMATGQTYLIPYINAGFALDAGQSPEKALQSAAISYAGTQVGGAVGTETGSTFAGNVAGGTTQGLLSGKPLEQSVAGSVTNAAISQVTPSTLLSSNGTTGATNMADTNFFSGYDPNQAIVEDNIFLAQNPYLPNNVDLTNVMTGGEGFGPGGNYLTPQEIARLQPTIYGGSSTSNMDITGGEGFYDTGSAPYTQAQIDALTGQTYSGTNGFSSLYAITQATIRRALAAGGSAAQAARNYLSSMGGGMNSNLLQGGAGTAAQLMQLQANRQAAQQAQARIGQATQQAVAGSQFRPVGTTTRFGTSQFQVDPATGQLTSAGYTAAPEITSAQNRLMSLGSSYLAQTPEEVAQQYMTRQYDLLDPSRQRQLAGIRNEAFRTGRGGLSVGSTGLRPSGGQGLMGANPELEAYYNALAQQDAQLAAQAQQAGQQNVLFGTGLFGQAGQLETMAQQPFSLSQGLAEKSSLGGARAGQLGIQGNVYGNAIGLSGAMTNNPYATVLGGLSSPTSLLAQGIGSYFSSPFGGTPQGGGAQLGQYMAGVTANPQTEQARMLAEQEAAFRY
jgi:hypothetical protein